MPWHATSSFHRNVHELPLDHAQKIGMEPLVLTENPFVIALQVADEFLRQEEGLVHLLVRGIYALVDDDETPIGVGDDVETSRQSPEATTKTLVLFADRNGRTTSLLGRFSRARRHGYGALP